MRNTWNIQGNIFGGITAAIIALPLGLAFGVASGLGATAGIYGAIVLGFFASLFGGTPTQISGPTGPMTVVIAAAVVTLHNDINLLVTAILLAGCFQIVFGFLKIGKWVQYIPYPVISGFMSGIGIIIILLQVNPFLGLGSDASILHLIAMLPSRLSQAHFAPMLLATITLLIMFLTPKKIGRIIPTPLIALVILTPVSVYTGLTLETIGEIPTSLPSFIVPAFDLANFKNIIIIAFTLALLGAIDTLLTSIVVDSVTQTKHNSNRELFGQGVGNILCSFVGGVPGAGATMRTIVNVKSGGTNRISGTLHAIVLLLIVIFLAPFASQIPMAILAGILIKVGYDILDYRFLRVWKGSPRNDLVVMVSVFLCTVFIDLITAVGVGIVLSSLLIVYRISKEANISIESEGHEKSKQYNLHEKQARLIKITGAFFFGSSTAFASGLDSVFDTKIIIIDILEVPFIDLTAIFTLKDLIIRLEGKGMRVVLVLRDKHRQKLLKLNKTHVFDSVDFYDDVDKAIESI
ncbi:MAG: SulP family inorganic anion transporter [Thermodesulfobacteriota bacterium]